MAVFSWRCVDLRLVVGSLVGVGTLDIQLEHRYLP
jgi:hypothetical protein